MALTNVQRQKQIAAQNGGGAYTGGLRGLSDSTASALGAYQAGYQESDAVKNARNQLNQTLAAKPAAYQSRYTGALDSLLDKITNPEKFTWNFDDDEMFKYYADRYTEKGRKAMIDTMGQAAALTGGYGNSYAQQVGQQTYDDYMLGLYEKGDQLRKEAYQRYQDEKADRYNQFGALGQQEDREYGRHQDEEANWRSDRDYYTGVYDSERNFDYNDYLQMLNYYTGLAGNENADYWNQQNWDFQQEQWQHQLEQERLAEELAAAQAALAAKGSGGSGGGPKTTQSTGLDETTRATIAKNVADSVANGSAPWKNTGKVIQPQAEIEFNKNKYTDMAKKLGYMK